MKEIYNYTSRTGNVLSQQLQILWRCAMVMAAVFAFSINTNAQDLPEAARCTSEDLQVLSASLSGTGCVTCEIGDPLSSTITFRIENTTGSLRTSYAYWGTVVVKDANGNIIGNPIPISGCNSDGFEGGEIRELVDATVINYGCGDQVEVINFYGAWTDASDNENRVCPLDPSKIAPKCDVVPVIPIRTPVVAIAGNDFTITCVLNPNGKQIGEAPQAGFTYSWSPTTGLSASNISNPIANPTSTTTYTVTKTRTVDNCSDTDQVTVTVNNAAVTAYAGEDFTKTCNTNPNGMQIGEASDAAFTYSWVPTTGLSNPNISNPVANPTGTTTYTVTKTNISSGCTDTDVIEVDVDIAPLGAPGGPDVDRCGAGSVTLAVANPLGGVTYRWYNVATNGTLLHTGPTYTTGNLTQTTPFWVTGTGVNECESSRTMITAIIRDPATAEAGDPLSACQSGTPSSITLSGADVGGGATTGAWSIISGGGSLSSTTQTANPETVTYTPAANFSGTVTLRLTTNDPSGACPAVYDERIITIGAAATAEAGGPNSACQSATPSAITLSGASVGGGATTGAWSIISGGGMLSSTSQTASPATVTYTPAANFYGTVTLRLTTNDPSGDCIADTDDRIITIYRAATAEAGGPYVVTCTEPRSVILSGTFGGGATSGTWSVPAGMGSVTGNVYTPSASALDAGTPVILTYTTNNPEGPCEAVSDVATVTFDVCEEFEGCTLGYWKNHTDRWCDEYEPTDRYGSIFVNAPSSIANWTLLQALNAKGGGIYNLARQSVAALLNACHDEVNYELSVAEVVYKVNRAYRYNSAGTLATYLDELNNAGCPLGGTRATTSTSTTQSLEGVQADRISAYPTPFSDKATIEFTVSKTGNYVVNLYDMKGALVKQLKAGTAKAGELQLVEVDGKGLGEGLYIARMISDSGAKSVKLLLKRQ